MSFAPSTPIAFRETAVSLGVAVSRMEADLTSEHMELLVNAGQPHIKLLSHQ